MAGLVRVSTARYRRLDDSIVVRDVAIGSGVAILGGSAPRSQIVAYLLCTHDLHGVRKPSPQGSRAPELGDLVNADIEGGCHGRATCIRAAPRDFPSIAMYPTSVFSPSSDARLDEILRIGNRAEFVLTRLEDVHNATEKCACGRMADGVGHPCGHPVCIACVPDRCPQCTVSPLDRNIDCTQHTHPPCPDPECNGRFLKGCSDWAGIGRELFEAVRTALADVRHQLADLAACVAEVRKY
ncbi:hypothetical protein FB107DRAFT_271447 [Schizophyllum commune]